MDAGPARNSGSSASARRVFESAERDYYDEISITAALADVDARHDLGILTDGEYEAAADMLFERLVAARAYHALREVQGDS